MKKAALAMVLVLTGAILSGSALAAGGRGGGGHGGSHGGGSRGGSHGGSHHGGSYHGGHYYGGVGVYFGAPAFWYGYYDPWYYYPRPYYYPYYAPAAPSEYVDRGSPAPAAEPEMPQGYWYYCTASQAYYPYVKECPGGWQPVSPVPADVSE